MNNFNNFLNHLNSFTKKQPIREQSSSDSSMKRLGKDLSNPTPIATGALAGAGVGFASGGPPGALVGSAVGALNGVAYNALPTMMNNFSPDDPELDTDFNRVQKRTEQEEQKRREDVSKANPDLAARMQEDPRNRPGIGMGIARAMNDMSRMQTKVNAANINENTHRSIFLNHLNSYSNNIQEQRKLTSYEQGAIERARIKKENDMAEFDKTLDELPTRMPANLRIPPARPTGSPKYVPSVSPNLSTSQDVPYDDRPSDTNAVMAMLNDPFKGGVNRNGIPAKSVIDMAAYHTNPAIALAALNHPLATEETAEIARSHPHSDVREAAASFQPQQSSGSLQPSTFAAAEASRQRFPRIDTGARDINGDPIKPAPTPGESAFKQWIRSF